MLNTEHKYVYLFSEGETKIQTHLNKLHSRYFKNPSLSIIIIGKRNSDKKERVIVFQTVWILTGKLGKEIMNIKNDVAPQETPMPTEVKSWLIAWGVDYGNNVMCRLRSMCSEFKFNSPS